MKRERLLTWGPFALMAAGLAAAVPAVGAALPGPGAALADAASGFLDALPAEQRSRARFAMEDAHRVEWFFVPIERKGLSLKQMSAEARERGQAFLKAALSAGGHQKVTRIMELEKVLAAMEKNPKRRDPELYYFSIFGTPSRTGTWGFRFEGHHLSLNFTVVNGAMTSTSPVFMGANPGEVRIDGPFRGWRVLEAEEELGRALVTSLSPEQRKKAIFDEKAPSDILTGNAPEVKPLPEAGLPTAQMKPAQVKLLRSLLDEYAGALPPALAKERLSRIEKAGFGKVTFAWAGGLSPGEGHYYRIQGPTFLVEYDNTQNGANHVHTVWREFDRDFGRDLLREHLKQAHGTPAASN